MRISTSSIHFILFIAVFLLPGQGFGKYVLRTDFGNGGVVTTGFGNYDDRAYDLAQQQDGKIVVVGQSDNGSDTDFAAVRYTENGSLDTSFNSDGKATVKLGSGDDGAYGVALFDDGSIVLAGFTTDEGQTSIALVRLTSSGYLDLDFGVGGQTVLKIDSSNVSANDVVIDGENRIVVCGTVESGGSKKAIAARFNRDGSLDTSFGSKGYSLIGSDEDLGADVIALQNDGSIVLGGVKENTSLEKAAVLRLDKNGTIDTTFGSSGQAILSLSTGDAKIQAISILADDRLVVAGYSTANDQKNITAYRLNGDGSLDTGFGTDGEVVVDLGLDSTAYGLQDEEDGGVVIVGVAQNGSNQDIVLVHLQSNGSLKKSVSLETVKKDGTDTSSTGTADEFEMVATQTDEEPLLTDIDGNDDQGRAIVILQNGRLAAAGATANGIDDDFALVAYEDDTEPVSTEAASSSSSVKPYLVLTLSVTNVNRNGALSGGVISENSAYNCGSTSSSTCPSAVSARGVVYATTPYPVYITSSESSTGTSTETSTTTDTSDTGVFPSWVTNTSYNYELVKSGQTSNGSDTGTYSSEISKVTPDTTYYVRAYALLADDTVIYGNQLTFTTDDACFIATAAFGSFLDSHVVVLRNFRDQYLKKSEFGRDFIRTYYQLSPRIADIISQSASLRFIVRLMLMPLVCFSYFMLYTPLTLKIALVLLVGTVIISRKRIFAQTIKR